MFAHTVSRLSEFGLSSEVGDAYSRALSSMLPSPHLPPLCSAPDFAELVGMLCREVNVLLATAAADGQISTQFAGASRSVSTTSEITKALQRLEAVLRAVPATLPATRAQLLLEFFAALFPAIAGMHGQHALAHAAVTALSSFFLQHGVQVYASLQPVSPPAPFRRFHRPPGFEAFPAAPMLGVTHRHDHMRIAGCPVLQLMVGPGSTRCVRR